VVLFAFVLKLALSLGHVHVRPAHAGPASTAHDHRDHDHGGHDHDAPSQPATPDHDENACPIYIVSHLIGSALAGTPPAVPPPPALAAEARQSLTESPRAAHPRDAFRSRAPPLA
jgi:hypothetical protein